MSAFALRRHVFGQTCGCSLPASGSRLCSQRLVSTQAKKGKEKKGAQKKGGGALAELLKKKEDSTQPVVEVSGEDLATPAQYKDPEVVMQLMMICQSYWKHYNEYLMEASFDQLAEALYKAPFVLLAHNKFEEGVTDPVFTYANRAALEAFEGTWDEIVGLPSRYSAEEGSAREDREQLLELASSSGSTKNYQGWRKSLKGKRFKLLDVKLFNVSELDGTLWGQAAVFNQYELEDGTLVTVKGEAPPPSAIEIPPSKEDVEAAEAAVAEQAAAVRALKEQQGLTNQDLEVQEAVAELQQRKQAYLDIQAKYDAALKEAEAAAAAPPTLDTLEEEEDGDK